MQRKTSSGKFSPASIFIFRSFTSGWMGPAHLRGGGPPVYWGYEKNTQQCTRGITSDWTDDDRLVLLAEFAVEPEADGGEDAGEGDEIRSDLGLAIAVGVGAGEQGLVVGADRVAGGASAEVVLEGSARAGAGRVEGAVDVAGREEGRSLRGAR
jgi:hypothetical protein